MLGGPPAPSATDCASRPVAGTLFTAWFGSRYNVIAIVITECVEMGTINLRIDDDLKARSYAVLDRLGVTPSELLRQTLEYGASQERLPFRTTVVTEDEEALLALVRERLASPQKGIRVSLDDL